MQESKQGKAFDNGIYIKRVPQANANTCLLFLIKKRSITEYLLKPELCQLGIDMHIVPRNMWTKFHLKNWWKVFDDADNNEAKGITILYLFSSKNRQAKNKEELRGQSPASVWYCLTMLYTIFQSYHCIISAQLPVLPVLFILTPMLQS